MGTSISYTTNRDKLVHTNTNMKVLVIVATLLSCSLAAPTELLKAYELPKVETIEYKAVAHPLPLAYHGLPLIKAAEGEEVEAPALLPFPAFPYHHAPALIAPAEVKEVAALPVLHAAPHAYAAEVRTFTLDHEPVVIPKVEPKVIQVAGPTSVHHTSYHAETKRVEHPVVVPHHSVSHVQPTIAVHQAPVAVHHAPVAVHHAPVAVHHAPAAYHHVAPVAVKHAY